MEKTITIDGKKVKFKATAAIPRLYRVKFHRDLIQDMTELEKSFQKVQNEEKEFGVTDLTVFENVAYVMAKHAAPEEVPASPDEWLEGFSMFSIYTILPQILELWNIDNLTLVPAKNK